MVKHKPTLKIGHVAHVQNWHKTCMVVPQIVLVSNISAGIAINSNIKTNKKY